MTDATEAAYRWLISEAALPWLALAAEHLPPTPSFLMRLRRDLSPEQAALVCQQAQLRERARKKFSRAEWMYFTPLGLEQATDERVAAYKATAFPSNARVADLCCGIGGDLIALAKRTTVCGVDRDVVLRIIAGANLVACGHSADQVRCGDVVDFQLSNVDFWHIDPDRRPDNQRTTNVDHQSPPWSVIEALLKKCPHAAIKLAPASRPPAPIEAAAECEWIGLRRECKQLLVRCGNLARYPGRRTATIVDGEAESETIVAESGGHIAHRDDISAFLYEPHPTLLAARMVPDVAANWQLASFALRVPHGGAAWGYLTADERLDAVGFNRFQVLQSLPFDRRKLIACVRENRWNIREIKMRGVSESPAQIRSWLPNTDGDPTVLFVAITRKGVRAIIARREPPN